MSALSIVGAAVAGGMLAVERKAFLQAQLSRPIVLGPLIGWILGDPLGGLLVGAPLELLWIAAANLGAALPQHETAAAAAIASSAVAAGSQGFGVTGTIACLAFALFAPVAVVGRRLERWGERLDERALERAERWLAEGDPERALREHLSSLWRPFVATAALVVVAAAGGGPLIAWIDRTIPTGLQVGFGVGWLLFWAVGGAAAVRASGVRGRTALAAVGLAAALAIGWVGSGGAAP
ncbi:MAG TPA: PTS sugar transporter subunit IIC [Vulgatibacter sp.]|nr:PTS sugar transporter subunit IIC [Vulgatibacter sp.]